MPLRLLIRRAARRIKRALAQAAVAAVAGKEKLAFTMDSAAAVVRPVQSSLEQCSAVQSGLAVVRFLEAERNL